MVTLQQTIGCQYIHLDNGIHKFVFTGQGKTGIDELFDYLRELWSTHTPDETLYYLVDTTHANG